MTTTTRRVSTGFLFGATLSLLLFFGTRPAQGDMHDVISAATSFATAVSNSNAAAAQASTTPELWGRMASSFAGNPAPGALGTYTVGQAAPLGAAGYGAVYLTCRHPDGVEDVVMVTLKQVNGAWKVCGGPSGLTKANPLQ